MRCVTLFDHGPRWKQGRTIYEQGPVIGEHLQSMRRLYDQETLLLGGPFDEGGGIAVLEAKNGATAGTLMEADPAVRAGILSFRLHRLHAYFDAFSSVRSAGTVADLAAHRLEG